LRVFPVAFDGTSAGAGAAMITDIGRSLVIQFTGAEFLIGCGLFA